MHFHRDPRFGPPLAQHGQTAIGAAVGTCDEALRDFLLLFFFLSIGASLDLSTLGQDLSRAIVILDGNHDYISRAAGPRLTVRPVIKADRDCAGAAAASVIAKVARDDLMVGLHDDLPAYQWVRNKGYASPEHRAAILEHGVSDHHRVSWAFAGAPTLF